MNGLQIQRVFFFLFCIGLVCSGVVRAEAQTVQFGESTQIFPEFAVGGGWNTSFTIYNPTTVSETVTIQMFRSDGTTFLNRDVSLLPSMSQTVAVDPPSQLSVGW